MNSCQIAYKLDRFTVAQVNFFFSWTENIFLLGGGGEGIDAIKCGLVKYGQHNG